MNGETERQTHEQIYAWTTRQPQNIMPRAPIDGGMIIN